MKIKYNLGQRCMPYLLLISLLLQSCVDSIIPNPDSRVGEVTEESQPLGLVPPKQEPNSPVEDQAIAPSEQPMSDALAITTADDEAITGAAPISNELAIYQGEVDSEPKAKRIKIEPHTCVNASSLTLNELPNEILNTVLSYVGSQGISQVRSVNKAFYKYTTGYEGPGKVGVENKPQAKLPTDWALNKRVIDFRPERNRRYNAKKELARKLAPTDIPSFPFYQLVGTLLYPPPTFWPYIKDASVHTVVITGNKLGDEGVVVLAKALQGTKVHTVNLGHSEIGAKGAVALAQALQGTSVHTVDLKYNKIGAKGAVAFAKALQDTRVHTVNLSANQLGAGGAVAFAKALKGTKVHTVNLGRNEIGAKGAVAFAQALKGTSVHTVDLKYNEIGDQGAVAFAKALHGTSVHTVDLSDNNIGDQGAVAFAQALQGTKVHTVDLRSNRQIGGETKALLKQEYPHIQWIFDYIIWRV